VSRAVVLNLILDLDGSRGCGIMEKAGDGVSFGESKSMMDLVRLLIRGS